MVGYVLSVVMVVIGSVFILAVAALQVRDFLHWSHPHLESPKSHLPKRSFGQVLADTDRGILISAILCLLTLACFGISQLPQALSVPAPTQDTPTDLIGPPGPTGARSGGILTVRCAPDRTFEVTYADGRTEKIGHCRYTGPVGEPGPDGLSGTEPYTKPRLGGSR